MTTILSSHSFDLPPHRIDGGVAQWRARLEHAEAALRGRFGPVHHLAAARIKGLRIQARTFLDEHRRELSREDAADLRTRIEDLDRLLTTLKE